MTLKTFGAGTLVASLMFVAAGCAGFHSDQPATQVYTLEPVFAPAAVEAGSNATTLQVLRPQAAPGLDTDRIALKRSAQRLDYYAASRWPAPLPELVQSLAVAALRASGKFTAVQPDATAFAADEVLQIEIRRCQAEYTDDGPPVVHLQLLATLGHRNERPAASISAESTVPAAENRMQAVVAAFQSATAAALADLAARVPR